MKLTSTSFGDGQPIPAEFAFCAPDAKTHCTLGANRNPQFAWSDLPAGTKSLALICHSCSTNQFPVPRTMLNARREKHAKSTHFERRLLEPSGYFWSPVPPLHAQPRIESTRLRAWRKRSL